MIEPMTAELATERLLLERVAPEQVGELQAVFRAAGAHFPTATGRPEPDPDSAEREFRSAAAAAGREVFLVRMRKGGAAVGAVGWWEGHPEPDVALLGMLLIDLQRGGEGLEG